MTLNIPIPDHLDPESIRQLDVATREFVAVRLYRQSHLSHGKFAQFLGIGRGEADEVLGRHGVVDEFTAEEIFYQVRISRELREKA